MPRRMHVVLGVRKAMMMAMHGRPPEHAALGAALGQHGQEELRKAARGEGPVGEISVVAGADAEHPQAIEHAAQHQRSAIERTSTLPSERRLTPDQIAAKQPRWTIRKGIAAG